MNTRTTSNLVDEMTRDAILKMRAAVLAEEPEAERDSDDLEVLEFRLAHETYGIETSYVSEVYPLKDYTPLAGTPAFILGIVNVRGQVFSIFDLRRFFDLPRQDEIALTQVIIVKANGMEVAIPAEEIISVQSISLASICPTLPTLTGGSAAYLRGMATDSMVLLDVAKLLADPKIIVNEEVNE